MITWIKHIFKTRVQPSAIQQPLRFEYLSKENAQSSVSLFFWRKDGEYVIGQPFAEGREVTYRLDRVQRWNDLSWKQISGYKAPAGRSPLDPSRLPR